MSPARCIPRASTGSLRSDAQPHRGACAPHHKADPASHREVRGRYDRREGSTLIGRAAVAEIVIESNDDDGDRSPVWKLSIDEFQRAATDPDHPLHDEAAAATLELGKRMNEALAPIVRTAFSGVEESLAKIARHTLGAIDWDGPLRKLSLHRPVDVASPDGLELLRVHETSTDIDIVSEVPEDTTMGEAVDTLVRKLDALVSAVQDGTAHADRHSQERSDESGGAAKIAKQGLATSRVALRASKNTLTVSVWMLVASSIAALTGIGAMVAGILTLIATK